MLEAELTKSVLFVIFDNRADSIRRYLMLSDKLIDTDIKSIFLGSTNKVFDLIKKQAQALGIQSLPHYISRESFHSLSSKTNITLYQAERTFSGVFNNFSSSQKYSENNKLGLLLNSLYINNEALVALHIEEELNKFITDLKSAEKILDEIKPLCIVYDTELPQRHRAILYSARQKKISILSMQHGEGYSLQTANLPLLSDYYIAYGFYNKEILRGMGVEENRIFLTGVPDTDLVYNYNAKEIKNELIEKYHIDFDKKIFLIALRPNVNEGYINLNTELLDICSENLENEDKFEIVVKQHPVDKCSYVQTDYFNLFTSKYRNMKIIEGDFTISKLHTVSDYFLTHKSSAIIEAILQNVSTIVIENDDAKWPDWNRYNVYMPAENKDLVRLLLEIKEGSYDEKTKYLKNGRDKFIRYFRYKFDNQATRRIAETIAEICKNKLKIDIGTENLISSNTELFRKGFEHLKRGEASKALKYFNYVEKHHTQLPDLHYARSIAFVQTGQLNLAKEACQKELMLQPKHHSARRFLKCIEDAITGFDEIRNSQRKQNLATLSENCTFNKNPYHFTYLCETDTEESTNTKIKSNNSNTKLAKIKEDLKNNIFTYTTRVSIELSSLCNYATIHKKCPLNLEKEPIFLSKKIVEKVINSMTIYDFKGTIAFHTYNEPMMDPRLFSFIHYLKEKRLECEIMIMTNGYYLNQTMADELVEAGIGSLYVTAYTPKDRHRLGKIMINIPYIIQEFHLDDRLKLYDKELPINENQTPCHAPLNEIIITRNGQISLCCLDWKRKHCFGNLYNESLEDVILYSDMASIYNSLSNGNRIFKICKLCGWSR